MRRTLARFHEEAEQGRARREAQNPMLRVERILRSLFAAFGSTPGFSQWARARAMQLLREGQRFELVVVWGGQRFRVDELPETEPYFAVELADGTLERSPHVNDAALLTRPRARSAHGERIAAAAAARIAAGGTWGRPPRADATMQAKVRQLAGSLSIRAIARKCGLSLGVVARVLAREGSYRAMSGCKR